MPPHQKLGIEKKHDQLPNGAKVSLEPYCNNRNTKGQSNTDDDQRNIEVLHQLGLMKSILIY